MATFFGKRCSFGLLCMPIAKVYQFVFASFIFGFDGGI